MSQGRRKSSHVQQGGAEDQDDIVLPSAISNRDFVSIGNAISKYTNTMERELEEQLIGITVTDDESEANQNPRVEVLEEEPVIELPDTNRVDLRYFQDGIQRTKFIGNVFSEPLKRLVPLMFTTVGAIIVYIDGVNVHQYIEPIISETFISPPREFLPKEISDVIPPENLKEIPGYSKSSKPNDFRKQVFEDDIRKMRDAAEKGIIREFEKRNPDDWLVVDGFITKTEPFDKKVGVIKRHGKEWLPPDLMFEVLKGFVNNNGMRVRSPLFKITYTVTHRPETLSCFSKLLYNFKASLATNPEFSLIRVETPYHYKDEMDAILNTILDLNSPMSNPSDSWDKKLFPILMAEKILKTHAKDDKTLKTAFGGLF
jgi:hypothetical protein